jgi:NAD(P)-dependent dehydrogenase (short-subunit alcohol dehydrogenase family)
MSVDKHMLGSSRLKGKTALVTGASRGIGLAIAQRLAYEGARVCITARDPSGLQEAASNFAPESVLTVAGKADDPAHQTEAITATIDAFGSLDFLVNNTGINLTYGTLLELELSAARKIFEVNCLAALSWVQLAHKEWMGEHGGSIVNTSSVAGLQPAPGIGFYGATKAMLSYLTAQLAVELGPTIRVNAIAPAVVKTKFASPLFETAEEEVASHYPLKRLGMPEDVSGAVAFLLSDDAAWLTGQIIVIDGGVTLTGGT